MLDRTQMDSQAGTATAADQGGFDPQQTDRQQTDRHQGDAQQTDPQQPHLQRAHGRASVVLAGAMPRTRLTGLYQSGCAKALLPQVEGPPEVVFLNTSGGVTGGDSLAYTLELGAGARACATTQTAERAYASAGGAAGRMDVTLTLDPGAMLDWLPQETILFEGSDLERHTTVDLAGDASILMCESVVLGRAAMGETIRGARLFDRREVRREGKPLLIDPVALGPGAYDTGAAGLSGARAVASVILAAPGAETAAAPLRDILSGHDVEGGVSGWEGRTLLRLTAGDGWPLRRALIAALSHLLTRRGGHELPRVWQV